MAGNDVLPPLIHQYIGLPRFRASNLADSHGDDSFLLKGTNLLASDVIPSQATYQANFLSPQNPGCRHSNIATRPPRYAGDIFSNNLFTRHWQPVYEAADIPVYGTAYDQPDHYVLALCRFTIPLR